MTSPCITLLGGSGFLGRYVVSALAKTGAQVRVVSRNAGKAVHLKTAGDVGQVTLFSANISNPKQLAAALSGADYVVNLVGLLYERGTQKFSHMHANAAAEVARAAKAAGVTHWVQVSALGVDRAENSTYAKTKLQGEQAVRAVFADATILRPSVIFGPEDAFFNQFAAMPALPLIGGGKTQFQPVYVGDVAQAIAACILHPQLRGKTYALGGPQVMNFRQIYEVVMRYTGAKPLIPIPFGAAQMLGALLQQSPCKPLLTRDQVRLLRYDNIVLPGQPGFAELGITPQPVEAIVPQYLARFRANESFAA